jgi:hypothetical protein
MAKKVWYSVLSGVDSRHLYDAKSFDRKKDALVYIEKLPLAPMGYPRAFKFYRNEQLEQWGHQRFDLLKERVV